MASVTFPVTLGGDGSTVSDDSNVSTGLANGGHRTRFVPALGQVVAMAAFMLPISQNALNAPGTSATSVSSILIGTGAKNLTLAQSGKAFAVGQWVQITNTAAPAANYMLGAVTAFDAGSGAMSVAVALAGGSGTLSSWAVHPASPLSVGVVMGADGSLLLTTSSAALGYGVGAGGSVTQITSKATGVTLNRSCGLITTHAASLAAGATVSFSLNCMPLQTGDCVIVNASPAAIGSYRVAVEGITAGLCRVVITNVTGGALAEAIPISFAIVRASTT